MDLRTKRKSTAYCSIFFLLRRWLMSYFTLTVLFESPYLQCVLLLVASLLKNCYLF